MKKRSVSWLLAGLILVVLLYPEKLTVVPIYHIKLIDQSGMPMAGIAVSELWQQTSVQRNATLEQRRTDSNGETTLPERTLRASLTERILGCFAYWNRTKQSEPCGKRFSISAAGDLKEFGRTETTTGVLKRQHTLVITLEQCDMREPELC